MAIRLLNGVEATGASVAVRAHGADKFMLETWYTNSGGSVTALVITLEGTNDNKATVNAGTATWDTLGTKTYSAAELTAKIGTLAVVNVTPEFVRCNVTTLTESGTTAVYALLSASKAGIKMI